MNAIVQRVCLLLLAIALVGCSPKEQEFKWTEDVKLQDGQVITVKRQSIFRGKKQTFHDELVWYSVEFQHPITKEAIRWESRRPLDTKELSNNLSANPEVLPALLLQAILVKKSDIYVVVEPGLHDVFGYLNCPDPPYLIYQWRAGTWHRVPLEEIPYRKFSVNVSSNDIRLRDVLLNKKHLGADVTSERKYMSAFPYIIDLTRMSRQTFGQQQCEKPFRAWTERDAYSN